MIKVYTTGLRPEYREAYIQAHSYLQPDLNERCKAAGMLHCSVHLLGDMLVLVVDAVDHHKLAEILSQDPIDIAWQNKMRPMKSDGDWQEMTSIFYVDL